MAPQWPKHPSRSLLHKFPDIAAEWGEANDRRPYEVTFGSMYVAWWRCSKNEEHIYQSRVNARTSGNGCPFCQGLRVNHTNSLEALRPDIAKEWCVTKNLLTPAQVTIGSDKKFWWICRKNSRHVWEASVSSRCNGHNCAICAGKVVIYETSLQHTHPKLSQEWDVDKNILKPCDVTAGSTKRVWWTCLQLGHPSWESDVNSRRRGQGCPKCALGHSDTHNLGVLYPDLVMQWSPRNECTIFDISPNHNQKVWWHCHFGHEWLSEPYVRVRGSLCPTCSKHQYSHAAIKWLAEVREKEGLTIQDAEHGGEFRVTLTNGKKTKVDGFCPDTNTVYEYHGNFFHGNLSIYKPEYVNPKCNKTMLQLLTDTLARECMIREAGYSLVVKWETDWCYADYLSVVRT